MKINLKNKIMLAVLAGGMLCMGQALADFTYKVDDGPEQTWDGTADLIGTGTKLEVWGPGQTSSMKIFGDCASVTAGKVVIIKSGTIGTVYGGYSDVNTDSSITGNTVNISGGFVDGSVYGGSSVGGSVTGNTVNISGGSVAGSVYGGNVSSGSATGNTVNISGGSVAGTVYGGYGLMMCSVTGNTVNISGGSVSKVYGGYIMMGGSSSGNTLNLKIKMSNKVNEIKFFQKMNFILPADIAGDDTMLETASVTYDNTIIGVDAANGVKLNSGDVITLIKADNINSTTIGNDGESVLGGAGVISMDDNNLILTMLQDFEQKAAAGGGNDDQQKAPVEGIAAGVAMINQSADLASGEGMASLQKETVDGFSNTYGAVTAGRSKYQTGSHVDMDGWGVLIGAGTTKNWTSGDKTTYGLFFEYGKGDFDTYNNDIHGEGDSKNEGVGIMARHTLKNNTYFDANIRYGKQETEWSESEIGGYDTDSRYYGAAVGLGHVYPLENKDELDVYVRYSYGHVGACDAKVKDSDYHFDRVLSQRLRLGAKYNFVQKDNKAKPYVGMAWERELKGESRATITGVGEAPAPSLKGNTGIFEIGCDWDTGKWILGAEANAYIGKRKGWSGMANAFYNF